jgi:Amidohydrolase family
MSLSNCLTALALFILAVPTRADDTDAPTLERYSVVSEGGKHGTISCETTKPRTTICHIHLNLRGRLLDMEEMAEIGADGAMSHFKNRGTGASGPTDENFDVSNGLAVWSSQNEQGQAPYRGPALYFPAGEALFPLTHAIERLVAAAGRTVSLLPAGGAHAEKLTSTQIGSGNSGQIVTAWAIYGVGRTPSAHWVDASGRYFASISGFSRIREGYESALPTLRDAQLVAFAALSARLSRQLARPLNRPAAFVHVRAFINGTHFAEDQTIVVERGKITALGETATIAAPKGSRVINGRGMTLVPGLWDAHQHIGDDYTGLTALSMGVTGIRDPGNIDAATLSRRDRRAKSQLLFPHVYASTMIDGDGPNFAQLGYIAHSQEEMLGIIRKAKENGQVGIKFYGSLPRSWLPAGVAEAHRLRLHVHGHLPTGMVPSDAIQLGFDEITHISMLALQTMPSDVIDGTLRLSIAQTIGARFGGVDLDSEPMKSLIQSMVQRQVAVDPTLSVIEPRYGLENGGVQPAFQPFVGTVPPLEERRFRNSRAYALGTGITRAQYFASFANMKKLVVRLFRAGVPIVAGTDGSVLEVVHELELYTEGGLTPAEALSTATLVPARIVGADSHTGSIEVGKDADLLMVQGDPSRRIGDLRNSRLVMMDGMLLDADQLRRAAGFTGYPR